MEIIFNNENGKIIHGDNIAVLGGLNEASVDSCISDFPYLRRRWQQILSNY